MGQSQSLACAGVWRPHDACSGVRSGAVCSQFFSNKGSVRSLCQNGIQRRGKRRAAHLQDPRVYEDTGLTYRQEIKAAFLAKRRAQATVMMNAEGMAASIAHHLLKIQG